MNSCNQLLSDYYKDRSLICKLQKIWPPAICVDGSVRTPEIKRSGKIAFELGEAIFASKYAIRTGGGPGLSEFPLLGYIKARDNAIGRKDKNYSTQGLRIKINISQKNSNLVESLYFFEEFPTRKQGLYVNSIGNIALPGGTGTIDETIEAWIAGIPTVFIGIEYWEPIFKHLISCWRSTKCQSKVKEDPLLTNSIDEAITYIQSKNKSTIYISERKKNAKNEELYKGLNKINKLSQSITLINPLASINSVYLNKLNAFIIKYIVKKIHIKIGLLETEKSKNFNFPLWKNKYHYIDIFMLSKQNNLCDNNYNKDIFFNLDDKCNYHALLMENTQLFVFFPNDLYAVNLALDCITTFRTKKRSPKPMLFFGTKFWHPLLESIKKAIELPGVKWLPELIEKNIYFIDDFEKMEETITDILKLR